MQEQKVLSGNIYGEFENLIKEKQINHLLLVCGKNVSKTEVGDYFVSHKKIGFVFQDFEPNPSYESVINAVACYKKHQCDGVFAIGGGSALDLAKCVKAFVTMEAGRDYLEQDILDNEVPFLAIPTTAGTGSEATKFAVIYRDGEKLSVEHDSLIPQYVFLDSRFLETLPLYQKKVTMLDALCHSVESFWAAGATKDSRMFADKALMMIIENYKAYLSGDSDAASHMLMASNYAGKAINISKTTAAHAMSYKLTKLYGLPHGHAAALSLLQVWEYTSDVADEKLQEVLKTLADIWKCHSVRQSIEAYRKLLLELEIDLEQQGHAGDVEILMNSVNQDRLKNHPVAFSKEQIQEMYSQIVKEM